jgi:hypothetical protein
MHKMAIAARPRLLLRLASVSVPPLVRLIGGTEHPIVSLPCSPPAYLPARLHVVPRS